MAVLAHSSHGKNKWVLIWHIQFFKQPGFVTFITLMLSCRLSDVHLLLTANKCVAQKCTVLHFSPDPDSLDKNCLCLQTLPQIRTKPMLSYWFTYHQSAYVARYPFVMKDKSILCLLNIILSLPAVHPSKIKSSVNELLCKLCNQSKKYSLKHSRQLTINFTAKKLFNSWYLIFLQGNE